MSPRVWDESELEPIQRAIEVRNLIELVNIDLRDSLDDMIGDSVRCDVKQLLTDLADSVTDLKVKIERTADRINELPASI